MSGIALPAALLALTLAAELALLLSRWRSPVGADEGYLWYGTLRLLERQVPIRDFRAYEPGRYLWCAPFLLLGGRSLLGMRVAGHVFHGLALATSLLLLWASGVTPLPLLAMLLLATGCALPQHKLFEPAIALLYIGAAAFAMAQPGIGSAMTFGVVLGLAATFGSNLALYTSFATAILLALHLPVGLLDSSLFLPWVLGLAIGAAPLLVLLVFARGFAQALFDWRVRRVLARGSSNLPLPVPWPWRGATPPLFHQPRWCRMLIGGGFLMLLLVPLAGCLALLAVGPVAAVSHQPALVAAIALACASWHHGFSRADPSHLAQSCIPAMLALSLAASAADVAWLAPIPAVLMAIALWPWFGRPPTDAERQAVDAGGWRIWLRPQQARLLQNTRSALAADARTEGHPSPLVALPTLAWMLPMLGLRSPVRDLFCVYPASTEQQETMISELADRQPPLAVIDTSVIDGDPQRCFANTHPRVLPWLRTHYHPLGAKPGPHLLCLRLQQPAAQSPPRDARAEDSDARISAATACASSPST